MLRRTAADSGDDSVHYHGSINMPANSNNNLNSNSSSSSSSMGSILPSTSSGPTTTTSATTSSASNTGSNLLLSLGITAATLSSGGGASSISSLSSMMIPSGTSTSTSSTSSSIPSSSSSPSTLASKKPAIISIILTLFILFYADPGGIGTAAYNIVTKGGSSSGVGGYFWGGQGGGACDDENKNSKKRNKSSSKRNGAASTTTSSYRRPHLDFEAMDPWGVDAGARDPFGSSSTMNCFGDEGSAEKTCVFRNLYLLEGSLYFVAGPTDAVEAIVIPPLLLGVPKWADNPWPRAVPQVISEAAFVNKLLHAGVDGAPATRSTLDEPILAYQRLNPDNIYHHLWDDMLPVYTLLREAYPSRIAQPGIPSSIKLVFTDSHAFDGPIDEAWFGLTTYQPQGWPDLLNPPSSTGTVYMIRSLAAGGRGRCTHRRHCHTDMRPYEVQEFKDHMLAYYGIVSVLPKKPTAIVIARTKRRLLTNIQDVVGVIRELGYETRIVGPFNGVPLRDQLREIANSSVAVFLHGAELGNAWLGMPEGSCASVIFPYYFTDTISWWVGDKLGIQIAPYFDMPNKPTDQRFSKPLESFDDALWIYHLDVTITPWLYKTSLWCATYPGFKAAPKKGVNDLSVGDDEDDEM